MKTRSAVILCAAVVLIAALSVLTFAGFSSGKYTYLPLSQAASGDFEYSGGTAVTVKVTGTDDPAGTVEALRSRFASLYPSAVCSAVGSDMLRVTDSRTGMAEYYENLATQKFRVEFRDSNGSAVLTKDDFDIGSMKIDRISASSMYFYTGLKLTQEGREKYLAFYDSAETKSLALYVDGQQFSSLAQIVYDRSSNMMKISHYQGSENDSYQSAQNLALYFTVKEIDADTAVIYHGEAKSALRGTALPRVQLISVIVLAAICLFLIVRFGLNGLCAAVSIYVAGILALTVPVLMELTISSSSILGLYAAMAVTIAGSIVQLSAIRRETGAGRTAAGALDAGCRSARAFVLDAAMAIGLGAMMVMYFGDAHACAFGQTLLFGTVFGASAVSVLTPLFARCLIRLAPAGKA